MSSSFTDLSYRKKLKQQWFGKMYNTIKYKEHGGLGKAGRKWDDICDKLKKNFINCSDT